MDDDESALRRRGGGGAQAVQEVIDVTIMHIVHAIVIVAEDRDPWFLRHELETKKRF